MSDLIRLIGAGDWTTEVRPALGGAQTMLTWRGIDILRPTPPDASDILQTANFVLVAQANRIDQGRFTFDGRTVQLPLNFRDHPHRLHGEGWQAPWGVETADAASVTMSYAHDGAGWPWPYLSRQTLRLDAEGFSHSLSLTNTGHQVMPAGLGFHPCFPNQGSAQLRAQVDGVWLADALSLATHHVGDLPFGDWPAGAPVASDVLIDHCHTGWNGVAYLRQSGADFTVKMTASANLGFLHIYSPPGAGVFCLEPVSHRPDAVNAADPVKDGVRFLAPGETLTAEMRIGLANERGSVFKSPKAGIAA